MSKDKPKTIPSQIKGELIDEPACFDEAAEREAFWRWWNKEGHNTPSNRVLWAEMVWLSAKKEAAEQATNGNGRPIVVTHETKPIPTCAFDWSAHREGWDEGEPIGYGSNRDSAIKDLLEREAEQAEPQPTPAPYNEEAEQAQVDARLDAWDYIGPEHEAYPSGYRDGWHDRAQQGAPEPVEYDEAAEEKALREYFLDRTGEPPNEVEAELWHYARRIDSKYKSQ